MDWMQPEDIKTVLKQFGLTPNKALGQNFFIDFAAMNSIVEAMDISGENVLEIGPGLGALTRLLCDKAKRVIAVEKDAHLAAALTELLPSEKLQVRREDFLKTDLEQIAADFNGCYHAAGNLPYYITSPIAMRLLTAGDALRSMTLMVQKEAAERFFSRPGTKQYGPLGILAALFWRAEHITVLHPAQYWPQPEVDSAVVRLTRSESRLPAGFASFLDGAFMQRRKTLYNNLKAMGVVAAQAEEVIENCGFAPSVRAEALEPEGLLALFEEMRHTLPLTK